MSEQSFLDLLQRYKATTDPDEMAKLSEEIERAIFHKQYKRQED